MPSDTKKLMFEIYRQANFSGRYRVVYFTELGEHDKEAEIADAMRGEHIFDGFLLNRERSEAKQAVDGILERLSCREAVGPSEIEQTLRPFLA